jgi:hypothetical protein
LGVKDMELEIKSLVIDLSILYHFLFTLPDCGNKTISWFYINIKKGKGRIPARVLITMDKYSI